MIEITEAARKEIVHFIANEQTASALRLFVKAGGCAGMSYGMAFEEAANSEDRTFEIEGVSVFLDPKSYLFLKGVRVDFKESLMGRGFVFENPNAKSACGCGTSFGV